MVFEKEETIIIKEVKLMCLFIFMKGKGEIIRN